MLRSEKLKIKTTAPRLYRGKFHLKRIFRAHKIFPYTSKFAHILVLNDEEEQLGFWQIGETKDHLDLTDHIAFPEKVTFTNDKRILLRKEFLLKKKKRLICGALLHIIKELRSIFLMRI